jgi:hypothetical protein
VWVCLPKKVAQAAITWVVLISKLSIDKIIPKC